MINLRVISKSRLIAKHLEYNFSIVLGHEDYYPRFGYLSAGSFGMKCPFDVSDANFMAINLQGNSVILNDVVKYAKEFFEK